MKNEKYGTVPKVSEIQKPVNDVKVVSLFSGIGGSSLGYKMAGAEVLLSVEFLNYQARNYRANNSTTTVLEADIREISAEDILKEIGMKKGELDILDGSPPCSAFSSAGTREKGWGSVKNYGNKKQRVDDLFEEYIRMIDGVRPKVFVAENVRGITTGSAKGYLKMIVHKMKALGYVVKLKVLNASHYGVPQIRRRVIFVGVREDIQTDFTYPEPTEESITLGEAFGDELNTVEDLAEASMVGKTLHGRAMKTSVVNRQDKKRFSLIKQQPNRPCDTLEAAAGNLGAGSVIHWDNRKFTVPECRTIAAFPEDFVVTGTWKERIEGFGRAVPPLMMRAVAEKIIVDILKQKVRWHDSE